jgi:c-di-GMP-binding flagellar brake protein YcgR
MAHSLLHETGMVEHEDFIRAPLMGPVRFWANDRQSVAVAREISAGGISLETDELVHPGARVTLQLNVPGGQTLTVVGEVVRTVRGGVLNAASMGVRFVDLVPDHQRSIITYVMRQVLQAAPAP